MRQRKGGVNRIHWASVPWQAPSSLTSLDIGKRWHDAGAQQDAPLNDVLQGISSLRRLSCKVRAPHPV